jgi:malonate-semialdehyde dehydrogenase (acetylating)/methylmalonate-semialdehyde dehydrogenase
MSTVVKNLIDGVWALPSGSDNACVHNPANGEVIAYTQFSTAADVDKAVEAGARAFSTWRHTPPVERARVLYVFKNRLEEHFDELARLVSLEHGKTFAESRGEVRRGIEVVEYACGIPTLLLGEVAEDVSKGIDSEVFREPLGVVAGITPFNFPAMVPLWMFPIAIACGNSFVLKPSEKVPLSSIRLGELLEESGLPAGVFNIVHGGKDTVDAIMSHPGIAAVSFVGSQPVAEYVYKTCAQYGKRVQALGGAKNFMIVMPDADLDRTASSINSSAFGCAGQRCLAGSVVVAVGDIKETLLSRLVKAASEFTVGDGLDADTDMGPVITREQRDRVLNIIERAITEGAKLVLDGRDRATGDSPGFYVGPTIFDCVEKSMSIMKEEIFGPVLSITEADDLDNAIMLANESEYGNAAVIFTQSGRYARRFRTMIQAGMLGVNIGVPAPMAFLPFAGWKKSFYGDLHATGKDGVEFYTEKKVITTRW